ncbi:TPA: acyltransferase family protein [Escherichia coli]
MKNLASIDYAKLLFAFCIVFIHTDILGGNGNYIGYITCQGLLRIAVPFFFIASGYFFYSTHQKKGTSKWFLQNIKIYITWTILYLPMQINLIGYIKGTAPLDINVTFLILNTIFGFWHLWFFPALIIAALITSVMTRLNDRTLIILCCVLYISGTLLQYRANYATYINRDLWSLATVFFTRNGLFMGFPLFMIGYLLKKYDLKKVNPYILSCSIALVVLEASTNYLHGNHAFDMLFSLPLAGTLVFLKVLSINTDKKNTLAIREHFKNIYLIQIYAILFAKHFATEWLMITIITCGICIVYSYANLFKDNLVASIRAKI